MSFINSSRAAARSNGDYMCAARVAFVYNIIKPRSARARVALAKLERLTKLLLLLRAPGVSGSINNGALHKVRDGTLYLFFFVRVIEGTIGWVPNILMSLVQL